MSNQKKELNNKRRPSYNEETKKYGLVSANGKNYTLNFRNKLITNKEIDDLYDNYNVDIEKIINRVNTILTKNNLEDLTTRETMPLIYLGSNLSILGFNYSDWLNYWKNKQPFERVSFASANIEFVKVAINKMGK